MTASAPTWSSLDYRRMPIPLAVFEVLGLLAVVAAATLAFLAGWLSVNAAVVLTVALLLTLIVLSWVHLGQGRHPVFLFLCTLTLFQGGRLIAFCLGVDPDPMQVAVLTSNPFELPRIEQGIVLLCVALSAICVYVPCRWSYRLVPPPDSSRFRRYLPFLYLVFFVGLPFLLYKNYSIYQYALQHGGYTYFFTNQRDVAAQVPFLVRSVSAILFPVFLAVYTFESRKKLLVVAAVLYLGTTSFLLLLGSRGAIFQLIVTLWYVTRAKSSAKPKLVLLAVAVVLLALLAGAIRQVRENSDDVFSSLPVVTALSDFIDMQGSSIDVTQVAVIHRHELEPHAATYLKNELTSSYTTFDAASYSRGKLFDFDASVWLNPLAFDLGFGTGGSYVGEAYLIGGVLGVVLISIAIGALLHFLHRMSRRSDLLFLAATILFSLVWLPRGDLLSWVSVFSRNLITIGLLATGWMIYSLIVTIRHKPAEAEQAPGQARLT